MSYLLPKRISELAVIDSDLDTPDKPKEKKLFKNYRLPKRVADMNVQESDSDDDKNDKFNCNILNDSFVLTPSKELDLGNTPCQKSRDSEENNKNSLNKIKVNSTAEDSGFLSRPNERKLNDETNPPLQPSGHLKVVHRPIKFRTELFPSKSALTEKSLEPAVPSVFQKSHQKLEPDSLKVSQSAPRLQPAAFEPPKAQECYKAPEHETPFKKADQPIFATPSLPIFRPQPFSNAKLPPYAHTCERKDKVQAKILFTTPIARPPPGSISMTPLDAQKAPPVVSRKLSPIKEPSACTEKPNEHTISINSIDYIIQKKIGSGGSSTVYLAKGKNTGRECAIKLVNLDGEPQVIDGYLNETKLLAKLQGNINVVRLFDYCHLPNKKILYMVMEKGESDLHKILQGFSGKPVPLYKLVSYWYQILQAVNFIHNNGVIHSDLKPANFLMVEGRLKLIDFGIASNIALESTSIIKFSQAGTFNYISPEALIDTSSDSPSTHHQPKIRMSKKSDVWSLGCILYLLLYMKTPFSHIKVLHQKIQALINPKTAIDYPQLPNFYPPMLIEMVRECLVFNPKERSSVADLLKYPFEMVIPVEK